ncbi:MAG: DUF1028 domain-containing protein [Deltaproteobacteria bacterium]|nr:DUF1028 domain-containing protein [Deltaproteobacteria bacterium]
MWRTVLLLVIGCRSESVMDGSAQQQKAAAALQCRGSAPYTVTPPLTGTTTSPLRPTNTFSIVARDPVTGDLGVAVQSHWFSVGTLVSWAEPGVGAVATQAFAEPAYGPKGLELMRNGATAPDALKQLTAADKLKQVRQLGFVDAAGNASSFTGEQCIVHADGYAGAGYAIQANMMANDLVVPAMKHAYETASGDLADRLLAALDAAQEVGGDIRGCQSAAILVVSGKRTPNAWEGRKLDLRVDDHPSPLVELRRLVHLARAYDLLNRGDALLEKGDVVGANEAYGAAGKLQPDHAEIAYWQGITWAGRGDFERAGPFLRKAFQADPAWIELVRRMPAAGLLPDNATAEKAIESGSK